MLKKRGIGPNTLKLLGLKKVIKTLNFFTYELTSETKGIRLRVFLISRATRLRGLRCVVLLRTIFLS